MDLARHLDGRGRVGRKTARSRCRTTSQSEAGQENPEHDAGEQPAERAEGPVGDQARSRWRRRSDDLAGIQRCRPEVGQIGLQLVQLARRALDLRAKDAGLARALVVDLVELLPELVLLLLERADLAVDLRDLALDKCR